MNINNFGVLTEPQAKVSVHIEEVQKDLEEQVDELHAQVCNCLQSTSHQNGVTYNVQLLL